MTTHQTVPVESGAAYAYVERALPTADIRQPYPAWHGWALREAFLAGISWARTAAPRPDEAKEVTGLNMYTASYDAWAAAMTQRPDDELARLALEAVEWLELPGCGVEEAALAKRIRAALVRVKE